MDALQTHDLPDSVKSKVRLFADDTIMYLTVKTSTGGSFFNMATFQEDTTMKKIMRRAHLSTVMGMCRCSDNVTLQTVSLFGHFFAEIQEFQNSDVTVSRTSVTICITMSGFYIRLYVELNNVFLKLRSIHSPSMLQTL